MARWRRLERMGGKLVRCSQIGHSTKGDLVSLPNFLAIHPYRRKVKADQPEGSGKAGVVIGDSFQYGYEPPDAKTEKTIDVSYQIWPYTEEWGRWVAAGAPDDWFRAKRKITHTVEVVQVSMWYKELPEGQTPGEMECYGYEVHTPPAQPLPDSDDGGGKMDYDTGYFVDPGKMSIGESFHYIDPMTGERRVVYQWVPKYTDYIFAEGLAKVRVTEKFSGVTYPSGRVQQEEKKEWEEIRKVRLTVRHHHDDLSESDGWLETLVTSELMYEGSLGDPPASLEKADAQDGEDTYVWENIDDPDNPRGIDYRKGAA